jgi:hypothetical protein
MMGYGHMSSGGMGEVQSSLSKFAESDVEAVANCISSLK